MSTPAGRPGIATVAVRRAEAGDLAALAELERRCFADPWSAAQLAAELEHPAALLLVAPASGPLEAYGAWRLAPGEAELLRLAVVPVARRRGVASLLLAAAEPVLARQGTERCHLEVRADNQPALAFYTRRGFEVIGRRRGYYRDGTAAVLMVRPVGAVPAHGEDGVGREEKGAGRPPGEEEPPGGGKVSSPCR